MRLDESARPRDRRIPLDASIESASLAQALDQWSRLLGAAHVIHDTRALDDANTATFATGARVHAIVRPATREDVQECVRIANRHHVPLYPISTGKNWGYGSRVPAGDGVLLDLGRLNRIVAFDEDLAYVTIEPGVTQRQLFEFLRERGSRLWMDATGASPDCSIIGNTLERGFGHTPMGDHAANSCGFEVVLPTGDRVETGFCRFSNAAAGPLSRWGVGPSLDGLFSQSNLGIVTRMSVWLMPKPEHFQAFFFMCDKADGLGAIIDALRPLRLNGTLRSVMHIGNDYKVVGASSQLHATGRWDDGPLDEAAMAELRRSMKIGYWNGSGGLYGTRAQVREARRLVKRALAGKVTRLQFVDDRLLAFMNRFATPFRMLTGWDVRKVLSVLDPVYNLQKGRPTDATLSSAYWRKTMPAPAQPDPDRDRCGLLWCSPVVPLTGEHLTKATRLAAETLLAHGFEPQMSISLATERTAICITTISYDRERPGDDARAEHCYRTLTDALLAHGYPPYRLNVEAMDYLDPKAPHTQVVRSIKRALDPNRILAPGRYEPERPSSLHLAKPS